MMVSIPSKPEELTAAWLSEALHKSGYLLAGHVERASIELMDSSKGVYSTLARLHLKYGASSPSLPETMIAKLPASNPDSAQYLRLDGGDRCEVFFYQQIRESIGLRIPECFFSGLDETTGSFVIIMEDLSAHRYSSAENGLTDHEIAAVVRSLATSNAAWWENPGLPDMNWARPPIPSTERFRSRFLTAWPVVVERLGGNSPALGGLAEPIVGQVLQAQERLSSPPITLMPGDVREENLFFAGPEEDPTPIFIDWQHLRRGRGPLCLASFLAFLTQRERLEESLLALYHYELARAGINDYPFQEYLQDYRLAMLWRFCLPTAILATVDPDSTQGTAVLNALSRFGIDNLERYL